MFLGTDQHRIHMVLVTDHDQTNFVVVHHFFEQTKQQDPLESDPDAIP